MKQEKEMSFLNHLEIFRWHMIRSIISILLFAILAFIFKDIVFDDILLAPKEPDFITYKILCDLSRSLGFSDFFCFVKSPFTLININMSGQFYSHIIVSLISGFIVAFPYILFEIWKFVGPALYDEESRIARGIVFFGSFLFVTGVCFGYYIISPLTINFLGSYQVSDLVVNQISLSSFVTTISTLCLANGLVFELPMLVYFLSKLGFLTPDLMRRFRKHSMVGALILSAIITPPDIMSQILVSLPLLILYEISIKICSFVIKK